MKIKKYFILLFIYLLFISISCSNETRDNRLDPKSDNYRTPYISLQVKGKITRNPSGVGWNGMVGAFSSESDCNNFTNPIFEAGISLNPGVTEITYLLSLDSVEKGESMTCYICAYLDYDRSSTLNTGDKYGVYTSNPLVVTETIENINIKVDSLTK